MGSHRQDSLARIQRGTSVVGAPPELGMAASVGRWAGIQTNEPNMGLGWAVTRMVAQGVLGACVGKGDSPQPEPEKLLGGCDVSVEAPRMNRHCGLQ